MKMLNHFHLPTDLGLFDIAADEVMYYLYLPVHTPSRTVLQYAQDAAAGVMMNRLCDKRLRFVLPLLVAVADDLGDDYLADKYVYLTIKKMFVGGGVTANRPGWHCDGFMSDDLNYVWYDCVPTLFTSFNPVITPDHTISLRQFEWHNKPFRDNVITYPNKHLLKLDDKVIHAVDTDVPEQLMRTFVKITVSKDRYNLKDNSKNPLLPDDGPFYDRLMVRNDPMHAQSDVYKPGE